MTPPKYPVIAKWLPGLKVIEASTGTLIGQSSSYVQFGTPQKTEDDSLALINASDLERELERGRACAERLRAREGLVMVGNSTWDFEGRDIGDCSRKESVVFARWPKKTNKGWRWLVNVRRVSTIEYGPCFLFWFINLGTIREEVIRWESL